METPRELKGGELLKNLFSKEPVHGLGRERFTPEQQSDVESLFSSVGFATSDEHIMNALPGHLVMTMIEYVNQPPGTDDRKALSEEIKTGLREVIDSL